VSNTGVRQQQWVSACATVGPNGSRSCLTFAQGDLGRAARIGAGRRHSLALEHLLRGSVRRGPSTSHSELELPFANAGVLFFSFGGWKSQIRGGEGLQADAPHRAAAPQFAALLSAVVAAGAG